MGILRSFNIGVTGLQAQGAGMGVIGDNIANAGTNGFKSSRAEFQDVLATSLKGIDGGDQFGAGTKLAHIKQIMSQGDVARTDVSTDLAINGNGFFAVKAPFGSGYSRDGSMHFNKDGELVNSDGYQVLGFKYNEKGEPTNKMESIKLGSATIPAESTTKVGLSMNIDSRADVKQFNIEKPDDTSNFNTSVTVYDNIGTPRIVNIYFNKVSNNNWEYRALVDGKDAEGGEEGKMVEMASGSLKFDDKGRLSEEVENSNAFNFNKGAQPGQKIEFDFGKAISEGGDGREASTQYGSTSTVSKTTSDGFEAATIGSLSFNDKGVLTAVYTNGESREVAQIGVAKFENNEGLFKMGRNLFKESKASGEVSMGRPGEGGRGEVLSRSIELSNVDLANEFVSLMNSQRNFTANAKALTTADQMLQEVLNIKR